MSNTDPAGASQAVGATAQSVVNAVENTAKSAPVDEKTALAQIASTLAANASQAVGQDASQAAQFAQKFAPALLDYAKKKAAGNPQADQDLADIQLDALLLASRLGVQLVQVADAAMVQAIQATAAVALKIVTAALTGAAVSAL